MENDSSRRRRETIKDEDGAKQQQDKKSECTEMCINTEISIPPVNASGGEITNVLQSIEILEQKQRTKFKNGLDSEETIITSIKRAFTSNDAEQQLAACKMILSNVCPTTRKDDKNNAESIISTPMSLYSLFDAMIEGNLVPKLIGFINQFDKGDLQESSAWILATIAKYKALLLVNLGAIEPLISLLRSTHPDISRPACYALSGIASSTVSTFGDRNDYSNKFFIEALIAEGIVDRTEEVCHEVLMERQFNISHLTAISTLIKSLCHVPKNIKANKEMYVFLDPLLSIIALSGDRDFGLVDQACWALYYLTKSGRENIIESVVARGIISKLISKLDNDTASNVIVPCVKVLGNIVSSSIDSHTEQVLNEGILGHLGRLMQVPEFASEINWIIGNIAAGTITQKNRVFEAGLLHMTIEILRSKDVAAAVKVEGMHTVLNFIETGAGGHRRYLIDEGLFSICVQLLQLHPAEILRLVVDCVHMTLDIFQALGEEERDEIFKIYEDSGILIEIGKFQDDIDDTITDKIAFVLDTYHKNDWM